MSAIDSKTHSENSALAQGVLDSPSNLPAFTEWLKTANCKNYSSMRIINSLTEASTRLLKLKLSDKPIWDIKRPKEFFYLQERALKDKLFCVFTKRKNLPLFQFCCKLYFAFLKDFQPAATTVPHDILGETERVIPQKNSINPDDVVAWLVTQPNANGTLYLERVVRSYMGTLNNAPSKLELSDSIKRNVFECSSVDELDSLVRLFKTAPNYAEINQTMGHGQLSAGLAVFRRYLEHLENKGDISSKIIETVSAESPSAKEMPDDGQCVDFFHPELCAQTRPLSCVIDGHNIMPSKQKWSQLLVAITEYYIKCNAPNLDALNSIALYGSKTFFLNEKAVFGTCALLSNGKWIYTNYNPQTVVAIIGNLCRHCGTDLINVTITFEPKNNERTIASIQSQNDESNQMLPIIPEIMDGEIRSAIKIALSEKFSNGFTYTKPIQIGRIKKIASEMIGKEICDSDESIVAYIKQCGTEFEGKIYVVSTDAKQKVKFLADAYFEQNGQVIFYDAFFENHEQFLMSSSITSKEVLQTLFKEIYKDSYFYDYAYFGKTIDNIYTVVTNEILRIWGYDRILSYSQISERLPYIPYFRIKAVLGQNGDFIINKRGRGESDGECIHASKIDILVDEITAIKESVSKACLSHRYVSLSDIDLSCISEKNEELCDSAVQTAAFQICLGGNSGDYVRRGKIITRKGDNIDAPSIMKRYCRTQDKLSIEELLAFEEELTGEKHRWIPMQAAYDTMIRIDAHTFVADKYIEFNINAADSAIEQFIGGGEYIPLQAVMTFALFPHCGRAWNLFLLESYCRRFSQGFRFETRAVNSKNVGAIVRKNSKLSYDDIMSDCVAHSNVALTPQDILNCLQDNGLISARKHKDIESLVKRIRMLREGRN